MTVVFGYTHVGSEIPRCSCGDPGNYMMCEQASSGHLTFRCWCGSTMKATANANEIAELRKNYSKVQP